MNVAIMLCIILMLASLAFARCGTQVQAAINRLKDVRFPRIVGPVLVVDTTELCWLERRTRPKFIVNALQVLISVSKAFHPSGAFYPCGLFDPTSTSSCARGSFPVARQCLTLWPELRLLRMAQCVASVIPVEQPAVLPEGVADNRLELMLLRVLTAEDSTKKPSGEDSITQDKSLQQSIESPNNQQNVLLQLLRMLSSPVRGDSSISNDESPEQLLLDLKTAGYQLVGESEVRLAETLQPTAAERVTVEPQRGKCDESLAIEWGIVSAKDGTVDGIADGSSLPYDGRVLIWRRGYGSEVRVDRLVVEKIDYLQAGLVSGALEPLAKRLGKARDATADAIQKLLDTVYKKVRGEDGVQSSVNESLPKILPMENVTLERSSLADELQGLTLKTLLPTLFGPTSITEPTFDELIIVWREKGPAVAARLTTAVRVISRTIRQAFDKNADGKVDGKELIDGIRSPGNMIKALKQALITIEEASPPPPPTEVLLFQDIPIANFALILPFSKPKFTASDWLRLDLFTLPAFFATLATLRFDDPRVNFAAASAVALLVFRILTSARNTSARYKVQLNRFVKDKVKLRGISTVAMRVATEAREQRARCAAALFGWLRAQRQPLVEVEVLEGAAEVLGQSVNLKSALQELCRLKLVREVSVAASSEEMSEQRLEVAPDAEALLREHWRGLLGEWPFDDEASLPSYESTGADEEENESSGSRGASSLSAPP